MTCKSSAANGYSDDRQGGVGLIANGYFRNASAITIVNALAGEVSWEVGVGFLHPFWDIKVGDFATDNGVVGAGRGCAKAKAEPIRIIRERKVFFIGQ